jgi:hypothetical protein
MLGRDRISHQAQPTPPRTFIPTQILSYTILSNLSPIYTAPSTSSKPILTTPALQKKQPTSSRAADQKTIDKTLLAAIKKEQFLASYLASNFSLRKGDKPHEMKW